MRIILDLQGGQNSSRFRGIGRYVMSLAQEMVRTGGDRHEIHVMLNRNLPEGLAGMAAAFDRLLPRSQLHVIELPKPTFEAAPENAWRTRAAELMREAVLHELNPDLVHVGSLFEGFADNCVSSIGALGRSIPTAITLYDMIPLLQPEVYLQHQAPRLWYHRKAQFAKRADLLLAISASSAAEARAVLDLPPGRVVTIGTGVDEKFRPVRVDATEELLLRQRYRLEKPFVMYAGAADARKNLYGLVEGFVRLPMPVRVLHCLLIVGKLTAEEIAGIRRYATVAGLSAGDLVFPGFVPDDDLIRLYSLCAAMVFPSFHEGFGLPAAEAMACGAAVIGSDRTSIPEVIGRADALFDPADPDSIARRLARVLTDPVFRDDLRRHGPVQASRFTWRDVAERSLAAFERLHRQRHPAVAVTPTPDVMPRVALVFPLPPEPFAPGPLPPGLDAITRYGARLLPELAKACDVAGIADPSGMDARLHATVPIRSHAWLREHAESFDHIVYSLADGMATPDLLATMRAHPGCVILHDATLSSILALGREAEAIRLLYAGHGWHAALFARRAGVPAAMRRFDCLLPFLSEMDVVVTHSPALVRHVRERVHPGGPDVVCVPPPSGGLPPGRAEARARLDLAPDGFVVCSLVSGDAGVQRQVLDGWLSLPGTVHGDTLLFACCHAARGVADAVIDDVARFGTDQVRVMQAADAMRDTLAASDLVLHLGDLPGADAAMLLPDLLRAGPPVLIGDAMAWSALPEEAACRLPPDADAATIAEALRRLRADPALRDGMAASLRAQGEGWAAPGATAAGIRSALEASVAGTARSAARAMRRKLSELREPPAPGDLAMAPAIVRANRQPVGPPRLFIDVTMLSMQRAGSDVGRICRGIVTEMTADPPAGYRVEPIRWLDGDYVHARQCVHELFGLDATGLVDEPLCTVSGDIYLGVDPIMEMISAVRPWFEAQRLRGIRTVFVFHDLLPVRHPTLFQPHAAALYREWITTVLELADAVVGVSRTVMHEIMSWLQEHPTCRTDPLPLGWFHPGSDLEAEPSDAGPSLDARLATRAFRQRDTVLSVGEIDLRKGYRQALAAFETLWASGVDVNYAIVGGRGWMEDAFFQQLEFHPERGRRLFWFEDVSDEVLAEIHREATAFLAASEVEGSGLPLVEAARFGLPIIARDILAFREATAGHASFFTTLSGTELAAYLAAWLPRRAAYEVPGSAMVPSHDWCASARSLADAAVREQWSTTWTPGADAS